MAKNYKELDVWNKAMELVDKVYDVTQNLPTAERFGIVSQIQRSAVSVPSNIAEGANRNNTKEFIQFIGIARGSLAELETQLLIAKRRDWINEQQFEPLNLLISDIGKMTYFLSSKLKEKL